MDLSPVHKEMVKGLLELGISHRVIAFMLFLMPEESQIIDAAKYITKMADAGKEINDSFILEYLTDLMSKAMKS